MPSIAQQIVSVLAAALHFLVRVIRFLIMVVAGRPPIIDDDDQYERLRATASDLERLPLLSPYSYDRWVWLTSDVVTQAVDTPSSEGSDDGLWMRGP
ncbi:hypothetical protein LTS10_008655 [Elasticomyces elasticus]|nr:hypothetical protein LTS10_008655 [Elasticomyces elasticus]